MTLDSKSFEIRRWHTANYVESWIANREQEDERRSLRKKLVSLLPFEPQASIRVLDLGAGGGALSQEILASFHNASIVCQDFSEVMLDHARQHLAKFTEQTIFVRSDLSNPDWAKSISGTFDAVVSSLVMHTVPSRVSEIYYEVFGLVRPDGYFVMADSFASPGPVLGEAYLKARLKAIQAAIKAKTGIEKSLEEVKRELIERRRNRDTGFPNRVRNPLRVTFTLANHLEWLKQAGFDEVDCPWKDMQRGIIIGIKHQI